MKETIFVRYAFARGPGNERQAGTLLEMNCQAWVHYDLRSLGVELPTSMRSKEIYEDTGEFFRTLGSDEKPKRGDVFLFGRASTEDARMLHLAIHSGYQAVYTFEPILTHATVVEKTVSAWPLDKFTHEPRYIKLFAIKRPIALD